MTHANVSGPKQDTCRFLTYKPVGSRATGLPTQRLEKLIFTQLVNKFAIF